MIQLDFRQKFYFTLGLTFLLLLLLLFGVLLPRFRAIARGIEELQTARQERSVLESQLAYIREFAKEADELDQNFKDIRETIFVDPKAPIEFVQFLEKTAADTGLSINITSASSAKGKIFEDALLFNIKISGPAPQTLRFLGKLEKAPYLIELKEFQLQGVQEQEGGHPSGLVSGQVSFLVYTNETPF